MATLTLQPDGTDGLDNHLAGYFPTTNYGTNVTVRSGGESADYTTFLLKFSGISAIPVGATITSVTLTLYCTQKDLTNSTLYIHGCLRNWVESESTWSIYSTGNSWTAGGGKSTSDHDAASCGSLLITSTGSKDITIATSIVQDWVDGARANYGFWCYQSYVANNAWNYYASSDNATAGNRPKLVVEYETGFVPKTMVF